MDPVFLYGSGGGFSTLFNRPSYQQKVVPPTSPPGRAVPDVALDGDPTTGMLVGETQTFPSGVAYGEYRVGGTSLSSPLMAGFQATTEQRAGGRQGFLNPTLYNDARHRPTLFIDIAGPGPDPGNVRADNVNGIDPSDGIAYTVKDVQPGLQPTSGSGLGSRHRHRVSEPAVPPAIQHAIGPVVQPRGAGPMPGAPRATIRRVEGSPGLGCRSTSAAKRPGVHHLLTMGPVRRDRCEHQLLLMCPSAARMLATLPRTPPPLPSQLRRGQLSISPISPRRPCRDAAEVREVADFSFPSAKRSRRDACQPLDRQDPGKRGLFCYPKRRGVEFMAIVAAARGRAAEVL